MTARTEAMFLMVSLFVMKLLRVFSISLQRGLKSQNQWLTRMVKKNLPKKLMKKRWQNYLCHSSKRISTLTVWLWLEVMIAISDKEFKTWHRLRMLSGLKITLREDSLNTTKTITFISLVKHQRVNWLTVMRWWSSLWLDSSRRTRLKFLNLM